MRSEKNTACPGLADGEILVAGVEDAGRIHTPHPNARLRRGRAGDCPVLYPIIGGAAEQRGP